MLKQERGRQLVRLDRDVVIPAGTVCRTVPVTGLTARTVTHALVMVDIDREVLSELEGVRRGGQLTTEGVVAAEKAEF